MPMRAEAACPRMRAATRFPADDRWGALRDNRQQRLSRQAFAQYHMPVLVHPHQVKNPFCQVDPRYARILVHWTRLLLCGMISPHSDIILAHRSRSATDLPCPFCRKANNF